MLPEIGEEGQQRLGRAKVLIVGLGGLGSISSSYLAAVGVGHLRIVDRDAVGLENLNRQLLHSTDDLGRPKVESASEKLLRLNPSCHVETKIVNIGDENASVLAKGCGLILDATDNLATRHVLNRISLWVSTFPCGDTHHLKASAAYSRPSSASFLRVGAPV